MRNEQRIVPCLWFDTQCEEAIDFYISVFRSAPHARGDSRVVSIQRYESGMQAPGTEQMLGKVITAVFELDGQRFMALDGGPVFRFNEAVSLCVECQDQEEIDHFWGMLSHVPEAEQCGWLKDRFGLSWQIVPAQLNEIVGSADRVRGIAALNALLAMKKIDIAQLKEAFDGA